MQPCWVNFDSLTHTEKSRKLKDSDEMCSLCFEPSNCFVFRNILTMNQDRQITEPMDVPQTRALTTLLSSIKPETTQSDSSGYTSAGDNQLSPTRSLWTSGSISLRKDQINKLTSFRSFKILQHLHLSTNHFRITKLRIPRQTSEIKQSNLPLKI